MAANAPAGLLRTAERAGRGTLRGVEAVGFAAVLLAQSVYYVAVGARTGQRVRLASVVDEAMEIGVRAIPVVSLLAATIGVMLAIQGIDTLAQFGAEAQVVVAIAFSVVREFAPLITGILVAGRSGSALAARLGTMTIRQEIDALRVIGVEPILFLVAPNLAAMIVMVPALTLWAMFTGLLAGGLYCSGILGIDLSVYWDRCIALLDVGDLLHGLGKSVLFGAVITLIGVVDGASVEGGAEGVGRVTTQSVVHAIVAIVLTDMLFAFMATRG